MRLKHLIKDLADITVKGSKEIEITGVTAHSQSVAPGNLFVAKGRGVEFIPQAIASGAVAILTDVYDPFLSGVVQIIYPDVSRIEQAFAERFFRRPSESLFLIGVTGTNGKTTTTYLISHILHQAGIDSGLIGSIERRIKEKILPPMLNTPDLLTTQKLLREMVDAGLTVASMEVTSHGLGQGRVDGIDFDVAVFTNLTQDHLDFHKTMEAYAEAKALLFSRLVSDKKWAVVNADDPASKIMLAQCPGRVITYGIDQGDLRATSIVLAPEGNSCDITYEGESVHLKTRLIGRFNVYNCLAAIGACLAFGIDLKTCANALATFFNVPGRMERVPNERGIHIFVDYSHTEDSLKNALETLRELTSGKITTVFGCGGDRDHDKRPKMGATAEALSDRIVITSDNPRSEDPQAILQDIVAGLKDPSKAHLEVMRKEAIRYALSEAKAGEIVLIAGKGHEQYQIFAGGSVPFDDRLVAQSLTQKGDDP